MSIKNLAVSLCVVMLLGCSDQTESKGPMHGPNSIYRSISIVVPKHYDAWVDTVILESVSGKIGWRAPIGIVTCCWEDPSGMNAEWQAMPGLVLIKWFSFADQQSYKALIKLENARGIEEKMKEVASLERYGEIVERPRHNLVFGLAPGGKVVVWIMNREENAIEAGRYEAKPYNDEQSDYSQWVDEYMKSSVDALVMFLWPQFCSGF